MDTPTQAAPANSGQTSPGSSPVPSLPAPNPDSKPSRFKTDATVLAELPSERSAREAAEQTAAQPPAGAETGRDPKTGKFLPRSGDPNAGVIDEIRQGQGEQQQNEQPIENSEGSPFLFEYTSPEGKRSVFKSQQALNAHIARITATGSAEARQNSELKAQLEQLKAKLEPPKPEKDAAPQTPQNPFEQDLLSDAMDDVLWKKVEQDVAEGKTTTAIARVVDVMQEKIKGLVGYIQHLQGEQMSPMQNFMQSLNSINETGQFFKERTTEVDESTGDLKYPGIRKRSDVVRLTEFMKKHSLPLTQEGFGLAYEVVIARNTAPGEQKTAEERGPSLEQQQGIAAGAAPLSSRGGRVPDPRAEARTPTWRDEYNAAGGKSGKFRTQ